MPLTREEIEAAEMRLQKQHPGYLTPVRLMGIARDPVTTSAERLDVLTVLEGLSQELDMARYAALDAGYQDPDTSWPQMGRAMGVSRQGAERRWLRLMPGEGGRDADAGRRGKPEPKKRTKQVPQRNVAAPENDVFALVFRDAGGVTDDRAGATHVVISAGGLHVATLEHATHPRYGVRGYTLSPPRGGLGLAQYSPERLRDGVLDAALQTRLWVDPAETQPDGARVDREWSTLPDLLATLRPLLKDTLLPDPE